MKKKNTRLHTRILHCKLSYHFQKKQNPDQILSHNICLYAQTIPQTISSRLQTPIQISPGANPIKVAYEIRQASFCNRGTHRQCLTGRYSDYRDRSMTAFR